MQMLKSPNTSGLASYACKSACKAALQRLGRVGAPLLVPSGSWPMAAEFHTNGRREATPTVLVRVASPVHHSPPHHHSNGVSTRPHIPDGVAHLSTSEQPTSSVLTPATDAVRRNLAMTNLHAKEESDEHFPLHTREPTVLSAQQSAAAPARSCSAQSATSKLMYKRIMLKISGEALQGSQGFGVDPKVLNTVAAEIKEARDAGLEVAVVVGGGNYFRGASAWEGLERASADYVGMLATCMNALLLQSALEYIGVETRVQTAIDMKEVAENYIRRRAIRHLEEGRVVIFGGGTGNPFFTTDTAAALRAAEMNAEVFMKATKVDGVYDSDPMKNKNAKKYNVLSYRDVTINQLAVMDETAITLCKENSIPVLVFNVMERHNVLRAARGEAVGTVVHSEECCRELEERLLLSASTNASASHSLDAAGVTSHVL